MFAPSSPCRNVRYYIRSVRVGCGCDKYPRHYRRSAARRAAFRALVKRKNLATDDGRAGLIDQRFRLSHVVFIASRELGNAPIYEMAGGLLEGRELACRDMPRVTLPDRE